MTDRKPPGGKAKGAAGLFAGLPDQVRRLATQASKALAQRNTEQVRQAFSILAESPADLDVAFDALNAKFSAAGKSELFLDLLLEKSSATFGRLRLIERTIFLARAVGREEEVLALIATIQPSEGKVVCWGANDRMSLGKNLGNNVIRELLRLKYLGVPVAPNQLLHSADALADRIDLPEAVLDRLHARSQYQGMSRRKWERHVRTAFAIDHLTKDYLRVESVNLARWIGSGSLARIRQQLDERLAGIDQSAGVLFATFHGGFSRLTIVLFQQLFQDGVIVMGGVGGPKGGDDGRYIRVVGHEREALFKALRALQSGKPLWIGADAPFGNAKQSISVLGEIAPVADGAPFLAFETRCPTVWLALVREGKGFALTTAEGPTRGPSEKYREFKERWFKFYGECIESFMTSDPRNLAMRPYWMKMLGSRQEMTTQAANQMPFHWL